MKLREYRVINDGRERQFALITHDPETGGREVRFLPRFCYEQPEEIVNALQHALEVPEILWPSEEQRS